MVESLYLLATDHCTTLAQAGGKAKARTVMVKGEAMGIRRTQDDGCLLQMYGACGSLLVAGVLVLCVPGCQGAQPSARVSQGWHKAPPQRLALIDVADNNPRPHDFSFWLIGGVSREYTRADQLASCIQQELIRAGFHVIERERVKEILKELDLQATDIVDSRRAKQFGKVAGVDSVVVGVSDYLSQEYIPGIFWSTAVYRGSARIIDVETGEVKATLSFDKSIVRPLWFAMVDDTLLQRAVREAISQLRRGDTSD